MVQRLSLLQPGSSRGGLTDGEVNQLISSALGIGVRVLVLAWRECPFLKTLYLHLLRRSMPIEMRLLTAYVTRYIYMVSFVRKSS